MGAPPGRRRWPQPGGAVAPLVLLLAAAANAQINVVGPTTTESPWPQCPEKGCLPCPEFSDGRPDCACVEGYSLTGEALENETDVAYLVWDDVAGWMGDCLPVECGVLERPPHAHPVGIFSFGPGERLVYDESQKYVCDAGYRVDDEIQSLPAEMSRVYQRLEQTFCSNDHTDNIVIFPGVSVAECHEYCDQHPDCTAFEHSCGQDCILLSYCQAQLTSSAACNTSLFLGVTLDPETLIEIHCQADGHLGSTMNATCVPICGDGRLAPKDHMSRYDQRQECDDGNREHGDGCSATCRVEPGWVCTGGDYNRADACRRSQLYVGSTLWIDISGRRLPDLLELELASLVAISDAVGCRQRDVEIHTLQRSVLNTTADEGGAPTTTTTQGIIGEGYHERRMQAQIGFHVKISNADELSIDSVEGALATVGVLLPKLVVAYARETSMHDLYVRPLDISAPEVVGDRTLGVVTGFSLRGLVMDILIYSSPLIFYLFIIGIVSPVIYWFMRIQPRTHRLMGRFEDISPEYKDGWAYNLCAWAEYKLMCLTMVFCLPARLADTWDSVGLIPYWRGLRQSLCCCLLYFIPGGCLCGSMIPGAQRSELRDFFGFGDKVKGNLELSDWCCWLCCPICCVMQEALHVDGALSILPPPFKERTVFDHGHHDEDDRDGHLRAPGQLAVMDGV